MHITHQRSSCSSVWPLVLFMIVFYALDMTRLFYIDTLDYRLVTWTLLALLFIGFICHKNPFDYVKLTKNIKKGVFWGIVIGGVQTLIYVAFWYFWKGSITINDQVSFRQFWHIVLMVGFIEEIFFRGFVLEYVRNIYTFRTANITQALLFMMTHVPYWYLFGQFSLPWYKIVYDFVFIFLFGLLEGFFLKKTNSLWTCIIHHSVNNFLVLVVK